MRDALAGLCVSLALARCAAPGHSARRVAEMPVADAIVLAVRAVPGGGPLDRWRADLAVVLGAQPVPSADLCVEVVLRTDAGRIVVLIRPRQAAPQPGTRVAVAATASGGGLLQTKFDPGSGLPPGSGR